MADVTYILSLKDQVSRTAKRIQSQLGRVTAQAEQAAGAIDGIGILAGGAAVAGIFKLGAELEQTTIFFDTLTGSVEKGTKLFEELTQFANTTPFSNTAINKNAQTLLAFGSDAEDVIRTIRMLGDVSGGSQDRLGSLTLAFAQIKAAGRLMGQDLLQLINAGFNPLQEISKRTGKSMGVLKEEMSDGLISFSMVEDSFKRATAEGGRFHNLTSKMATTMAGKWSTVLGKGIFLISELGLAMKGLFVPILDQLIRVIDMMSKYRDTIFPILKALSVFTVIVIGLIGVLKLWVIVQKVLNALLIANPIGLVITAIAVLIALVVVAYQESEKFRNILDGVFRAIKAIWRVLSTALAPILNSLIISIRSLWRNFKEFFDLFDFGVDQIGLFGQIINFLVTQILPTVLLPIISIVNVFKDYFNILSKVGQLMKAVFSGDFSAAKKAFIALGNTMKEFFEKRIKLFLKGFGLLATAVKHFFSGDFTKSVSSALKGVRQIVFSPFGTDAEAVADLAKKSAKSAVNAFNNSVEAAKISPLLNGSTDPSKTPVIPGLIPSQPGNEIKKLQAEGIVAGGGIKSFNIHIGTLTGINTLSTENIQESASQAGQAIRDELLKVLADTKQLG